MNDVAKIHIFDVEHGSCNVIETPNNQLIMIDCGHNSTTGWRPSSWIVENGLSITNLTISNIDEDHVSDLPNIEEKCRPETIRTNWHLSPDWIEKKKRGTGGVGPGVQVLLNYKRYIFTGDSRVINYGLERRRFCHPPSKFDDFNNLSIVTFIFYAGIAIVFPGDVAKPGWEEFLKESDFRSCLQRSNIFIASHHGRIDGYCESVFDYCSPDIVVISDKAIEHETQLHDEYSAHVPNGVVVDTNIRKVLTTRKDGKITIVITSTGQYTVHI